VIVEGAFAKTLFPTNEQPRRPGLLHICYCLAVTRPIVLMAYSSSQPWPAGIPLPLGVRIFDATEAARLNQRPFVLYLNRLVRLSLTPEWFPELNKPSQGVVAVAPAALRDQLLKTMMELMQRRRDLIQKLGP
jgi:hypothetical protein